VFFGGVDPDNLTGRALEALMDPALAYLAVDVVLGRQSPHHRSVADLVNRRPSTTLHGPMPSLAGLIARADLAIGAGGATTWERACLGLPSALTAVAENQISVLTKLANDCYIHLYTSHWIREAPTLMDLLRMLKEKQSFPITDSGKSESLTSGSGTAAISQIVIPSQLLRAPSFPDDHSICYRLFWLYWQKLQCAPRRTGGEWPKSR
jgi:spore coat polysaccharide biosynthesis predicted glycosyltransferase SpsG